MTPKNKKKCQFCKKEFYYLKRHEKACRFNPKNLRRCAQCNKPITSRYSKKFCSHSCSASFSNPRRGRKKKTYLKECIKCGKSFEVSGYQKKDIKICKCCKNKNCPTCGKEIKRKHPNTQYCSEICRRKYNKGAKYKKLNKAAKKKRIKLINIKGGKCEICGWDESFVALEFHHKNPSEKEFSISHIKLLNYEKDWKYQ